MTRYTLGTVTSLKKRVTRAFTDVHVALIRTSNGRAGTRMGTMDLYVLTSTGRQSGVERHNPVA